MIELPAGLADFTARAGWADAAVQPLPGDASFRRYFRLVRDSGETAMLMHAPPPHEDPAPFLHVADWLTANGMRGPSIIAAEADAGWVLTEDFGNDRMRDWLDANPGDERAAYEAAVEALVALHRLPPGSFAPYDMATYQREAALLTEWYCPAQGLEVDAAGYAAAWEEVLSPLLTRQQPGVTVLRDYHAENIMLLHGQPGAPQGLIDFQDALWGIRPMILSRCCRTRGATCRKTSKPRCCCITPIIQGPPTMNSWPTTPASARSAMPRSSAFSPGSTGGTASPNILP
jgi:Predicted phosphotransferase related to Ser/Thr protein kinases